MSEEQQRTLTENWKWRRREAIIRDDYTCRECETTGGPKGDAQLEVHHITPVSKGGSDDLENLETLCQSCHRTKRDNPGSFDKQYSTDAIIDAVQKHFPAATSEVADEIDMTRQGADARLRRLHEAGVVEKKKIAAALVWFVDADNE